MNAHPHSVPFVTDTEAPALPDVSSFAEHLMQAATSLRRCLAGGMSRRLVVRSFISPPCNGSR